MLFEASTSQWRIVIHIVPKVSHHIPFEPGFAIDVGGIRVLGSRAFAKNAVGIIAKEIPRHMSRIVPIHLISLEGNEVIGRVFKCSRPGFLCKFC